MWIFSGCGMSAWAKGEPCKASTAISIKCNHIMCIMSFHCTDMIYPFTFYNFQMYLYIGVAYYNCMVVDIWQWLRPCINRQCLSACSYVSFSTVLVPFSVYCLVIFKYDYYVRSYYVRVWGVWVIIVDIYQVVDVCLALLIFSLTTFGLIYFLSLIIVSIGWS